MKKYFTFLLMLLEAVPTFAQGNLVLNPSFEQMDTCPNSLDQARFALGWSSYKQSPDYYNSCAGINSIVSVPSNVAGFQMAHSGNGYIGLQTFFTPVTREIIGSEFLSPMIIGQEYFISIYLSCAFDTSAQGGQIACASNKIGVKFSTVPYSINSPAPIDIFAQVFVDSILSDTSNWFQLTGSFFADSAYNYVMVGNFFDDLNSDTLQFLPNFFRAYYLIDDICINDKPECILSSQTNELHFANPLLFDQLNKKHFINFSGGVPDKLLIYNLYGNLVYIESSFSNKIINEILMSNFNDGIYIAYLKKTGTTYKLKFQVI